MSKVRKIPQRMCVGCREMKNKKALIRIVRTPEEQIVIDSTGKKAGRGAYICPDPQCFKIAIKGKSLEKALERRVPEDVFAELQKELMID